MAFPTGWTHWKVVTLNHAYVGSTLTDFTALVSRVDSDVNAHAQADGDDIRFSADSDTPASAYPFEHIGPFTAGTLLENVLLPSVSAVADTTFRVWYGNPSATDGQNAAGTYDSNTKGMWHLEEDPSGSAPQVKDSTSNANHGTSAGSMTSGELVSGQVGKGLSFDGSNDAIDFGSLGGIPATGSLSVLVYKTGSWAENDPIFTARNGSPLRLFDLYVANIYLYAGWYDNGLDQRARWSSHPATDQWVQLDLTWTNGGTTTLYYNGSSVATSSGLNATWDTSGVSAFLAEDALNGPGFSAIKTDELRLSASARSTDWIALDYQLKLGGGALTYSADQANEVTFDALADKAYQLGSSTYSFNVTVAEHNARYLRVNVGITSGSKTVSSIKRATSGADQNLSLLTSRANGTYRAEIWELIAPAVGTYSVTVTLSGACDSRPTALVYYGVHQTTPSEATAGATGSSGGDATVSVTPIATGDWISSCCTSDDNFGSIAAITGQTAHSDTAATTSGSMGSADTNGIASGATTMGFTGISGDGVNWAIVAAAIRPLSAVTSSTFTGTGSLTTTHMTVSGSATFSPGTHTATGGLSTQHQTLAASATFSPGTHTASGSLSTTHQTLLGSATFSLGTHTASGALATQHTTLSGSAVFALSAFIGSGSLNVSHQTVAGSSTFSGGTHTATGVLITAHETLSGLATHVPPTFHASAVLVCAPETLAGTATFTVPVYHGSATLLISQVTALAFAGVRAIKYPGGAELIRLGLAAEVQYVGLTAQLIGN